MPALSADGVILESERMMVRIHLPAFYKPKYLNSISISTDIMENNTSTLKKLDGNYIAGFVDGEGCFFVRLYKKKRKKWLEIPYYTPEFSIKIREDDWHILQRIKHTIGCGKLIRKKEKHRHNRSVGFVVYKKLDLIEKVVPFFDKYPLQGKKKVDFNLWKEAVLMWKNNIHRTKDGVKRLEKIKEEINKFRPELTSGIDKVFGKNIFGEPIHKNITKKYNYFHSNQST